MVEFHIDGEFADGHVSGELSGGPSGGFSDDDGCDPVAEMTAAMSDMSWRITSMSFVVGNSVGWSRECLFAGGPLSGCGGATGLVGWTWYSGCS